MRYFYILLASFSLVLCLGFIIQPQVQAQAPNEEVYTVQVGDTLTKISLQYQVSVADLAAYNNIANPDLILVGQRLVIPVQTEAQPEPEPPLSTTSITPTTQAAGLTPTSELRTYTIQSGDTLFLIAQRFGVRLARLAEVNGITNPDLIDIGQVLVIPDVALLVETPLSYPFTAINFSETEIAQGRTLVMRVELAEPASLSVFLEDRPVILAGSGTDYWGMVGIHALSEVGLYELTFRATLADGQDVNLTRNILVVNGPYPSETIQVIPGRESLLQPEVVQQEFDYINQIWTGFSPVQRWAGPFHFPVDNTRVTSAFGTRRAYQGGEVASYHAGTDFGGSSGTPIYAPTPGLVAMAEPLSVRGNAILLDHGLGLYSGYWHLSEILVEAGQEVQTGDLIGLMGDTGLVTGPHLHWEMRLAGIAVEPLQWVQESIP